MYSVGTQENDEKISNQIICSGMHVEDQHCSERPIRASEYLYKTRFCEPHSKGLRCHLGDRCTYAHGPQELRPKKSFCRPFAESGTCPFRVCKFQHVLFGDHDNNISLREDSHRYFNHQSVPEIRSNDQFRRGDQSFIGNIEQQQNTDPDNTYIVEAVSQRLHHHNYLMNGEKHHQFYEDQKVSCVGHDNGDPMARETRLDEMGYQMYSNPYSQIVDQQPLHYQFDQQLPRGNVYYDDKSAGVLSRTSHCLVANVARVWKNSDSGDRIEQSNTSALPMTKTQLAQFSAERCKSGGYCQSFECKSPDLSVNSLNSSLNNTEFSPGQSTYTQTSGYAKFSGDDISTDRYQVGNNYIPVVENHHFIPNDSILNHGYQHSKSPICQDEGVAEAELSSFLYLPQENMTYGLQLYQFCRRVPTQALSNVAPMHYED